VLCSYFRLRCRLPLSIPGTPLIPNSRACPHQVPQFSISGITPYFRNHGYIYEDRHAARSRMPSKQTDLTDKAKLDHRIRTIQALVDFCKVQEAPRRRRWPPSRDRGLVGRCGLRDAEAPKPPPNPSPPRTPSVYFTWKSAAATGDSVILLLSATQGEGAR
jgi:hypothetical protein